MTQIDGSPYAGRFDPLEIQPYANISWSVVGSAEHEALAYDAALQGMVLLRNDANILPLQRGTSIAIVGPHATTTCELNGNYFEDVCFEANCGCVPTILAAFTAANFNGTVTYSPGADMTSSNISMIPAAVAIAQLADVIVLAIGISTQNCNEGTVSNASS
jgi:beta-D-xylosidase 4